MSGIIRLRHCDREQDVLDAIRSGRWATVWGEDIRRHAARCSVCAEVASLVQEFQREAELVQAELQQAGTGLPSAGLIWWKAQLAARRAAEQRVAEPIVLVERVASALVLIAALCFGVWQWPRITAWLQVQSLRRVAALAGYSSSTGWLHRFVQSWVNQTPAYLLAASAAACVSLLAFAAYVVWREE
jgi:hypothetical protein